MSNFNYTRDIDNEQNIKYYTSLVKNFNNVTKIEKVTFAYPR